MELGAIRISSARSDIDLWNCRLFPERQLHEGW